MSEYAGIYLGPSEPEKYKNMTERGCWKKLYGHYVIYSSPHHWVEMNHDIHAVYKPTLATEPKATPK